MSFNVRDSNILVGPLAGVELPNGAGQSTVVAHQVLEPVGLFGASATTFANGSYTVWITPPNPSGASGLVPLGQQYKVVGGSYTLNTGGTSATLAIEICNAGVANGSGNNVLSTATIGLASGNQTGSTPASLTLASNIDNLLLAPNSRINFISAGTVTGLAGFTAQLYVVRVS